MRFLRQPVPKDQSRRASWRQRSDFPFGLADSESGSAATGPVSATMRERDTRAAGPRSRPVRQHVDHVAGPIPEEEPAYPPRLGLKLVDDLGTHGNRGLVSGVDVVNLD